MSLSPNEMRSRFWQSLADAASAHVIALTDSGIIDLPAQGALLLAVDAARGSEVPPMPFALLAPRFDERIETNAAPGVAGAALVGRGSTDLTVTAMRLVIRDELLAVLIRLQSTSLSIESFAASHAVTLLAAFSNGIALQPTSLGHLVSSLVAALERATLSGVAALEELNLSPLGAGALTGSGFGHDREREAALLGFTHEIEQTVDAVTGTDWALALANTGDRIAAPITRWLDELLMMSRTDPTSISVDDSWGLYEITTPQWQSPGGISALASHGRRTIGAAQALRTTAISIPFGTTLAETGSLLGASLDLLGSLDVLLERSTALMDTALIVNRAALANRAGKAFVTSGDLADFLIVEAGLEPAPARGIAGLVIGRAREAGVEVSGITPEMIDTAALMMIGREIGVEFEAISRYLAPRRFIERRNVSGGPAPSAVRSWLAAATARREQQETILQAVASRIHGASEERSAALSSAMADIAG